MLLASISTLVLAARAARVSTVDPALEAAKAACKDAEWYADCIEGRAVESLDPDICRLLGIGVDDACLQSVYQAANDPTICDRLYLEGVRPTCRAYYAARSRVTAAANTPTAAATPTTRPSSTPSPSPGPTATEFLWPVGSGPVLTCLDLYPGLDCASTLVPLPGVRLAFVDPRPGLDSHPHSIDLGTKQLWVLGQQPSRLVGWSPSGEYLLTTQGEDTYAVYSFDGTTATVVPSQSAPPFWAPPDAFFGATDWLAVPTVDGSLRAQPFPRGQARPILPKGSLGSGGGASVVWSGGGRVAWTLSLDQLAAGGKLEQDLHVTTADGNSKTVTWRLSDDVRQAYYQVLDWAPGTSLLLAGKGMTGNSLWSWPVPLVAIDADTGKIRDLGASMLLTPESHAWHPTQPGLLALAEGGGRYLTQPNRLALLDVSSGEVKVLRGEGMSVFEPAWSPDGKSLAYAAVSVPAEAQGDGAALERLLEGRAIYVVDPATSQTRAVTNPGTAIDGWPQWSSDGSRLLYTRQREGHTDVRIVSLKGYGDKLFLTGLPDPTCFYAGCGWGQMLALHAEEP